MNTNRILGIVIAVLGVWAGAGAAFDTLLGHTIAVIVTTAAGLAVATLGAVIGVTSNQTNQVKAVLAMDGVEHIDVNARANPTLAAMAVDPDVDKIAPIPSETAKVEATAKGA